MVGVHLVGGIIGSLLIGLFASSITGDGEPNGLFGPLLAGQGFIDTSGLALLAVQVIAVVAVLIYSFVVTYVIGKVIDLAMGFRIAEHIETNGLDHELHAESAYAFDELDELEGGDKLSSPTPPGEEVTLR